MGVSGVRAGISAIEGVLAGSRGKALAISNITESGVTVLGSHPGYINKAKALGASYFDIGSHWNKLTATQQWAANTHFLDVIAAQGQKVLLSVPSVEVRAGSYLEREIAYLKDLGYQAVNQWYLKPPGL